MFVDKFTRVECLSCGGVYSVLTTLDDDRYDIKFCTICGNDDIECYAEESTEEE